MPTPVSPTESCELVGARGLELERDAAAVGHRLDRVVDEHAQQLGELLGVAGDDRGRARGHVDADAGGSARAQLVGGVADQARQVDAIEVAIAALARELLHAADGGGAVEGDLAQALERVGGRGPIGDERGEHAGLAEDGVERVVEVVRDAARHLAERAHALGAHQLGLLRPSSRPRPRRAGARRARGEGRARRRGR